ncbi:MAG: methyl-accepting chemotaxis protein [Alphaproteobacteria bacterium]|nr:methyl-accepting chemotaxis protein [Alphaproteobacteria bacterium]
MNSIKTKLAIILVLVGVLPAIAIGIDFHIQKEHLHAERKHDLTNIAKNMGDVIDRNLFERYGDVQAFGYNTAAHDPANWQNPSSSNVLTISMNDYVKAYGLYPLMMLVDMRGNPLNVNTVAADGSKIKTSFIYSKNFSQEKWFQDAVNENFLKSDTLTGTAVGEPQRNSLVAEIYQNDGYVIPFSAPVFNTSGERIGVWVNFAQMSLVEDIVGEFRKSLIDSGLGDLDLMLVDPSGKVVVDYDPQQLNEAGLLGHDWDNLLVKNFVKDGFEPAILANKGETGSWEGINPDSGDEALVMYTKTDGAYNYPGLGWSVLLTATPESAFKTLIKVERAMIIVQIIAFVISLVVAWFVGSSFARPIKNSATVIQSIADGNTDVTIIGGDRKDEIGDLARASLVFKDAVIERRKLAAAQEEAEKQALIEKKRAQHELANKFESRVQGIIQTVASASTELYQTAESMGGMIGNVNNKVVSVSGASQSASNNVNSVAAATEEMSATVREIAGQIAHSVDSVRSAVRNVNRAGETSVELEQSAKKIGEIVVLIQSIASQINLLALNATIESARAGEAGKGFAVVAGEVKALATQTSKATDQIASYVQSIQNVSSEMVSALQSVKGSMSSVEEYSTAMSAAVEEQSAATNEIASNMGSAASITEQINSDITEVHQATAEANSSASQVLDAAKMLSKEAESLNHAVNSFLSEIRNG